MGCGSSSTVVPTVVDTDTVIESITQNTDLDIHKKYPPPEAFEIPVDDASNSLIRKHPPKRLQRLVDPPNLQTATLEDLEEKLANAELRRNEILLQRVNTFKAKEGSQENINTVDDDDEKSIALNNNKEQNDMS